MSSSPLYGVGDALVMASSPLYGVGDALVVASSPLYGVGDALIVASLPRYRGRYAMVVKALSDRIDIVVEYNSRKFLYILLHLLLDKHQQPPDFLR